jgi:hypothetical protein
LAEKSNKLHPKTDELGHRLLVAVRLLFAFRRRSLLDKAVQLAEDPVPCVPMLF